MAYNDYLKDLDVYKKTQSDWDLAQKQATTYLNQRNAIVGEEPGWNNLTYQNGHFYNSYGLQVPDGWSTADWSKNSAQLYPNQYKQYQSDLSSYGQRKTNYETQYGAEPKAVAQPVEPLLENYFKNPSQLAPQDLITTQVGDWEYYKYPGQDWKAREILKDQNGNWAGYGKQRSGINIQYNQNKGTWMFGYDNADFSEVMGEVPTSLQQQYNDYFPNYNEIIKTDQNRIDNEYSKSLVDNAPLLGDNLLDTGNDVMSMDPISGQTDFYNQAYTPVSEILFNPGETIDKRLGGIYTEGFGGSNGERITGGEETETGSVL